jgi:protoporphyrinogen oxidase
LSDGIVILGAGLAGLSAAFHLRKGFEVFEAADRAGGCPADYSGQLLNLDDKAVREMVEGLLPGSLKGQKAAAICSEGGMQTLVDALVQRVKAVSYGQRAVEIDTARKTVVFGTGYTAWYDGLISTIPLQELLKLIKDAPGDIADAAAIPGTLLQDAVPGIMDYLNSKGIISIGRYGALGYPGTGGPIKEGIEAAMAIRGFA